MKTTKRTTTYTVELSEQEYDAIRLLSERVRNYESYVNGESWFEDISDMIGKENATIIADMFNVHAEDVK